MNTYLTHNPLKGIDLVTPERLEGYIHIEGYLVGIKEHITKKREAMGFLTIITQLGQIEALLFPRDYRSSASGKMVHL